MYFTPSKLFAFLSAFPVGSNVLEGDLSWCPWDQAHLLLFLNLFILGRARSSFLHAGFLWLQRAGATLCHRAWVSHCRGFSCCRAQALGVRASAVVCTGLAALQHVESSQTRARWILNHRTTTEVLSTASGPW